MEWGCMTAHGVGYLIRIDRRLDEQLYCKISEDELMKTLEYNEMENDSTILQQDSDTKHPSRKAKKCLQDLDIHVIQWSPQSPNLDLTAYPWDVLKNKLISYQNPPQGIHE